MSSRSRQQLETWLKEIELPNLCNVLDIGGSQNPIESRLGNKGEDSYYQILDLENPHENKKAPDIVYDINNYLPFFKDENKKWFGYFDVAFCIEVMEYVYDPMSAFRLMNDLLKPGGVLYISFHTLYGLHNPKGEDCLRYTKNAIVKLAEKNGFKIVDIETKTTSDPGMVALESFYKREGMRLDFNDMQTYEEGYLVIMQKV